LRALSVDEVLYIHSQVIAASGGSYGLRDRGALESSVSQPAQTFAGAELYPDVVSKAAALAFFLSSNHPFVDGNKRVAHAALVVMLRLNAFSLSAPVDEQEDVMLRLASGQLTRETFTAWVQSRTTQRA
jgi:death on curing protein